jgi:hypothetical protein
LLLLQVHVQLRWLPFSHVLDAVTSALLGLKLILILY